MKISACMIARDEARCIERCIKSYRKIVDEVIVVDTGSQDDTVRLAEKLGAQVLHQPWENDFSKAKNTALDAASGDWVLFLDADEYLADKCAPRLQQFLEKTHRDPQVDGVRIRLHNIVPEGQAPSYVPSLRAFRLSPDIRYHGKVHEQLLRGGEGLHTVMAPPDKISILHDGYVGALGRSKPQRNIDIMLAMREAGEADSLIDYYLGDSYLHLGRYQDARRHLDAFLQAEAGAAGPVVLAAMLNLETTLRMLAGQEDVSAARAALAGDVLARFATHPTAHLMAGNAAFEAGDLAAALPHYRQALALHATFNAPDERSGNLMAGAWPGVHLRVAQCYEAAGDTAAALSACEQALEQQPALPGAIAVYCRCRHGDDPQQVGAALLALCAKGAGVEQCLQALRETRCDLAYLMLYDRRQRETPARDACFTTMQAVIGQGDTAVRDVAARLTQHPLWQGDSERLMAMADPVERGDLQQALVEAVAIALALQEAPLLELLLAVSPPALQDALCLCLGREVESLSIPGAEYLPAVRARLAPLGASPEVQAMWDEILGFYSQPA